MVLTKHLSPWIVGLAVLVTLAFVVPGLAKLALILLTLALAYLAYEAFRDKDTGPAITVTAFTVISAYFAATVSQ